jgi:hypothetical protein
MQVKVWNDNVHPYQENFREKNILIPAKSFIMMEESDAQLFYGSFAPIKVDADGNPIPEGYKMIRIDQTIDEAPVAPVVNENICQACRHEAPNMKSLQAHIFETHKDIALVDEDAEREIGRRKKARAG